MINFEGINPMRRIIYTCLLLTSFFFLSCKSTDELNYNGVPIEDTDIDEFYTVVVPTSEIPEECRLASYEEPKIFYASNLDSDLYLLRSNYHYVIGYATWNGPASSVNDIEKNAKVLCKNYGAKIAVYSYEYTDTRSGWTQTFGSYSIKRYDCSLYLFVPYERSYIEQPKLGIAWRDLNTSERLSAQRNTGAYIAVVYEKSAAFYANLSKGDIITEINGVPIIDSDSVYYATMFLRAGDSVMIKYLRNGFEQTAEFEVY